MVDRELGIFHYFPAQERLWGKDVFDPLKVFNVYGFSICHCHANVLAMLFKAAGLHARSQSAAGDGDADDAPGRRAAVRGELPAPAA